MGLTVAALRFEVVEVCDGHGRICGHRDRHARVSDYADAVRLATSWMATARQVTVYAWPAGQSQAARFAVRHFTQHTPGDRRVTSWSGWVGSRHTGFCDDVDGIPELLR